MPEEPQIFGNFKQEFGNLVTCNDVARVVIWVVRRQSNSFELLHLNVVTILERNRNIFSYESERIFTQDQVYLNLPQQFS